MAMVGDFVKYMNGEISGLHAFTSDFEKQMFLTYISPIHVTLLSLLRKNWSYNYSAIHVTHIYTQDYITQNKYQLKSSFVCCCFVSWCHTFTSLGDPLTMSSTLSIPLYLVLVVGVVGHKFVIKMMVALNKLRCMTATAFYQSQLQSDMCSM